MAVQNSNFNTLITAIDTKAQSLAASTSDPKDLVYLGKTLEALNVTATVSDIINAGDTQVTAVNSAGSSLVSGVNTAGTTQVGLVNTAGANQVAAVAGAASSYSLHPNGTTTAIDKTIVEDEFLLVTAAGKTITLPSAPTAGQSVVYISVGNFVNTVVNRNGNKIMGLAQDIQVFGIRGIEE